MRLFSFLHRWYRDESGLAAVESALIFPVLLMMLLGTFDMGNAILANQKAIRASQVVADLITRNVNVDDGIIDEVIEAGRLAFDPLATGSYGVDIVSVGFDDDADPEIIWRETENMTPMGDVEARVASVADANSGVVVVAVEYQFDPIFVGFVMDTIAMQEVAFAKGRQSSVVCHEDLPC